MADRPLYASEARSRLTSLSDSRAWAAIARSENPADFLNYRTQFPNGTYAEQARRREAELRARASEPATEDRGASGFVARVAWPAIVRPREGRTTTGRTCIMPRRSTFRTWFAAL